MSGEGLRALIESLERVPALGEPIDQLQHALQTAALAIAAGADDDLVLASALHDIGRAPAVRQRYPSLQHEDAAAEFLSDFLSRRVVWLVRSHVDAKCYLVHAETYAGTLSARSTETLLEQGGPMSEAEAHAFLAQRWSRDAIELRRWDDAAKVPGAPVPRIDDVVARYAP